MSQDAGAKTVSHEGGIAHRSGIGSRLFIAAMMVAAVPLLGWWAYGLFDIDEGFYASVTSEMNRRGEWITPYYNGEPWFEKPVFLYWLCKPALALFGESFGPRLPSVLCTLLTYALTFWFVRRRLGLAAAVCSTLVLATSLLVAVVGRLMITDAPLALFFSLALFSFWESLVGDVRWRLVTAAALGLAVLTKGPAFLILFLAIAAYTFFRERELRPKFKGSWIAGTLLMLAVIATWYLPAYLKDRDLFTGEFLIKQNIARFAGGDLAHTVPWHLGLLYYPLTLTLGMFPWLFWLGHGWPRRDPNGADSILSRYVAAWALIVILFFTVSGAKLPHYVLPACVPLAILIGLGLSRRPARSAGLLTAWAAVVFVVAHFGSAAFYRASGQQELHRLATWLRDQGGRYAAYQMQRQPKLPRHAGRLPIDDQSRPSLPFYLRTTVLETERLEPLLAAEKPLWILTRWNRITEKDLEAVRDRGFMLRRVSTPTPQEQYALWKLERAPRGAMTNVFER